MNSLNNWFTLLTNIGVIAGLAVLVYEVNQNSQALQNETDVAIFSIAADNRQLLVENSEFRHLYQRIETKQWDQLTPDEQMMLLGYWSNELDRTQLQFMLYRRNGADLEEMDIIFYSRDLLLEPFKALWLDLKKIYDPDFVVFFDGVIEDANDDQ